MCLCDVLYCDNKKIQLFSSRTDWTAEMFHNIAIFNLANNIDDIDIADILGSQIVSISQRQHWPITNSHSHFTHVVLFICSTSGMFGREKWNYFQLLVTKYGFGMHKHTLNVLEWTNIMRRYMPSPYKILLLLTGRCKMWKCESAKTRAAIKCGFADVRIFEVVKCGEILWILSADVMADVWWPALAGYFS